MENKEIITKIEASEEAIKKSVIDLSTALNFEMQNLRMQVEELMREVREQKKG